jgi:Abi-like protein.
MPKNFDFTDMVKLTSSARLSSYRSTFTIADDAELFGLYSWNLELSGAFCSLIQLIEVAIRNAINEAGKKYITTEHNVHWFNVIPYSLSCEINSDVKCDGKDKLVKSAKVKGFESGIVKAERNARKMLQKKLGKDTLATPTLDQIISQTDFSVWEHILDKSFYDGDASKGYLWPKGFATAFKKMPMVTGKNRQFKQRDIIRRRVEAVRVLRNRVAHNEPIWKDACFIDRSSVIRCLEEKIADIVELAYWISPVLHAFIRDGALVQRLKSIVCAYEMNNAMYLNLSSNIDSMETLIQVLQECHVYNRRIMIQNENIKALVCANKNRFY